MWRLAVLRCLIALSWIVAGLSSAQVVYGHPRAWRVICMHATAREMTAEGVESPTDEAHWRDCYRRADELRSRLLGLERLGYYGWLLAMSAGAATAIGLMVVFPGVRVAVQRQAEPGAAADPAS